MDFMEQGRKAIDLFDNLVKAGMTSNHIPFTCVLSACSHFLLLEDCKSYFESMKELRIAYKLNNCVWYAFLAMQDNFLKQRNYL